MIKVNLLPVKKKKKSRPVPAFLSATVIFTLLTAGIMLYVNYFYGTRVMARKAQVEENDKKIKELQNKIKAVEDFEKRNADYKKRKEIIEQLGKNRTLPVKLIDEICNIVPSGVWLGSLDLNGADLNMACTGFTNTDVVNFVNNLKNSKLLNEVYLRESVQSSIGGFTVYTFRITCKVRT
jgi:type IV pilus assembly protein PilN